MSFVTKVDDSSDGHRPRPLSKVRSRHCVGLGADAFRLRLVSEEELDTSVVGREFPTISVERGASVAEEDVEIDDFAWRGAFDVRPFDDVVERAEPLASIAVRGDDAVGVACEVMTRYQRLLARRNRSSATAGFDAILEAYAALCEGPDPLRKADHDHALDTWQWTLRLEPDASLAVQIAALLHDLDRLDVELHDRIEHRARDRENGSERNVGERAFALVSKEGIPRDLAARVRDLAGRHGDAANDPEVHLVDDADALSFLSLQSCRYADHFGLAQTKRKVAFTMGRLTPRARDKLALVRLRPDVDRIVRDLVAKGHRQTA